MEVIKEGRVQKAHSFELTCTGDGNGGGGCNAVLLVSIDDLYSKTWNLFVATITGVRRDTFCCPQCGTETDVEKKSEDLGGLLEGFPRGERPPESQRKRAK